MQTIKKRFAWLFATLCAFALLMSGASLAWADEAAYLTVYLKDAGTGATEQVKAYTKDQLAELATPVTASAMNGTVQLYTTNNMVTFEDLFADAGIDVQPTDVVNASAADGFSLKTTWTWADMQEGMFFPNASADDAYNQDDAVPVTPGLGLNCATAKNYAGTAGAAEGANLQTLKDDPATGASSTPRLMLGIPAKYFNAENASNKAVMGGMRCINGVNAVYVTLRTADVPQAKSFTYNGKSQTALKAGTGFTVSGAAAKNAGSYKATCTLQEGYVWADGTTDPKAVNWKIGKASQKVTGKSSVTKTFTAAKSGKYKGKLKATKTISSLRTTYGLKSTTGKTCKVVSYGSSAAKKYVAVSNSGKVYVKKGLKKGTYTLKIRVNARETANYQSASKTITLKIKVK